MVNYYYKIKYYTLDYAIILLLFVYSFIVNRKIFIVSKPYGRWGNRLMLFSYMIAWAKQHNALVLNPSFLEYKDYFRNFNKNIIGINPSRSYHLLKLPNFFLIIFNESLKRISYRQINIKKVICFDLESEDRSYEFKSFQNILYSNNVIFFFGFLFGKRNFSFVNSQRKELKLLFEFSTNILQQSNLILNSIGKAKIIGICMRQGDYKNHFNGKLYLHDNEYKFLIDRVQRLFGDEYGVFVACEEKKEKSIHNGAYFNYGEPAVNLCILSKCDYLIGPASTFMTWASFINNVKTCYIDRDNFKTKELLFLETTF